MRAKGTALAATPPPRWSGPIVWAALYGISTVFRSFTGTKAATGPPPDRVTRNVQAKLFAATP